MITNHHAQLDDGRRLNYAVDGDGDPTVVFESGLGASRSCWAAVQAAITPRLRAVSYDRAGLGASDPDPLPRTLDRAAGDLRALLNHLDGTTYILVGHSWGAPIVRQVAATNDSVVGLVLVDPADEDCEVYYSRWAIAPQRAMAFLLPLAAHLGILRWGLGRLGANLPEPARHDLIRQDGSPQSARAFRAEFQSVVSDLQDLRRHPPELGTRPVTIISGGRTTRFGSAARASLVAAHQRRAGGLAQGRHVWAKASGHMVPYSEPATVAEQILFIVDELAS
ncbi:MAG: alpha/beta fold hydrolase [Acidimicrobiales bacterium]